MARANCRDGFFYIPEFLDGFWDSCFDFLINRNGMFSSWLNYAHENGKLHSSMSRDGGSWWGCSSKV